MSFAIKETTAAQGEIGMRSSRVLTQEQVDVARSLIERGKSWHEAARIVGSNYDTVRRELDSGWKQHRNDQVRDRLNALRVRSARHISMPVRAPRDKKKLVPRSAKPAKTSSPQPDAQTQSDRQAVRANNAFVLAMRRAIKDGTESPSVGTIATPCTDHPRFSPGVGPVIGFCSSPAALCAES